MKNILALMLLAIFCGCKEESANEANIHSQENVPKEDIKARISKEEAELKEKGYQAFSYQYDDTIYLMQQYYVAFLKRGSNTNQDSLQLAKLQKQHLEHLTWLYENGYTSLTGPMGDDGELRGLVVFNTPNGTLADSLAKLDPMVKAGRLNVEIKPWWVAKGGKLK